jgi:acyl-CoA thioester hydrolase
VTTAHRGNDQDRVFVHGGAVRWSDTDASGRFHYTAPLRWAEEAEHRYCRMAVPAADMARLPRRAAEASYCNPLEAGDTYEVELRVERIGHTSITYAWHITGRAVLCVTGRHTVVHVDESGRPAVVPSPLRAHLLELKTSGD